MPMCLAPIVFKFVLISAAFLLAVFLHSRVGPTTCAITAPRPSPLGRLARKDMAHAKKKRYRVAGTPITERVSSSRSAEVTVR